jgi:signal transduction histidine kinase
MGYNTESTSGRRGVVTVTRGRRMSISVGHGAPSTVRLGPGEPPQFRFFAAAVVVVAAGSLALTNVVWTQHPQVTELAAWVVLVATAGLAPLGRESGPRLAMDLPLLLAAAFSFDPFSAGLIAFAGAADIREFRREISVFRAVWNRAQTCLSVMAASATFSALGALDDWPRTPVAALLALGADASVNYLIVGYGTSLRTGQQMSAALREMRIGSAPAFLVTYGCFGFLGVLIAEAYAAFGLAGVVASMAPVVLGSQAFRSLFRLDRTQRRLQARGEALRRVDQRIADERRDERSRIAAALHDEVLQDLYNISVRAQVLRQDLLNGRLFDLEEDVPAVIRAIEAAVEDLRQVIQGLRSATVGHAGLVETLTLFADHAKTESTTKIVSSLDPQIRTTPERELVVYQIAREALVNALRHARARTIWLTLKRAETPGEYVVIVEDDGCGFDMEGPALEGHFGLELMRERAESIGASLSVRSAAGTGTVLALRFTA